MKTKILFINSLLLCIFFFSCSNDSEFDVPTNDPPTSSEIANKDKNIARFSEILSKAVYERKEVRDFLKSQALAKIDNGYNVFYPIAKDKMLSTGITLRDILIKHSSLSDIEKIEESLPLLNIHVPEITGIKVSEIDTEDKEIPIMHSNHIYLNGAIVDSLSNDEIPGFSLFVVDESGSIQKKQAGLRSSTSSDLSLSGEYELVDLVFSPVYSDQSQPQMRASGKEVLAAKYNRNGWVPRVDIDPALLSAYQNSINRLSATRCLMYYGMTSPSQTPGNVRPDVTDCVFRFKIAGDAFERLEGIATDNGKNPFFNGSTSNKKSGLSRDEVLRQLLTGRAFCFMFRIEGDINGQTVVSEGMKVYVTPEKLFNLHINESKRHSTMFRHSKYTYSINKNNIEEKWFYPMDHGHDTRLNEWDVAYQPITKRIVVYLVDPNDGMSKQITERYSLTYVTSNEVGADITGKIKEIVSIGINGKISKSTTTTREVTTTYTVNLKNEKLDEFYFNFFNDYPIVSTMQNGSYILPVRRGKGVIETSIVPITTSFFTHKRFK